MPAKTASGPTGRLLSEFAPLLPAEERLRDACRAGQFAVFGDARPEAKTEANHLRPAVLRVFCLGLDPAAPVHEHGVRIRGAWIEGEGDDDLDLEGCGLPSPLALWNCRLTGRLVARDATAKQLIFADSHCAGITADRLTCAGSIYLRDGFRAEGEVRFLGSTIGGDLDCTDGAFAAGEGHALAFDGAKIGGDVVLNGTFRAEATVRFLGATIGGTLDCTDGTFAAGEGHALFFDSAKIGGDVVLNGTFRAEATVRFLGATIGGTLDCTDGTFAASEGHALAFDRAKIGGTVFLNGTFRAEATVRFPGATIDGDLVCTDGTFAASEGDALFFDGAKIGGTVFLNGRFRAEATVRFPGGSIGGYLFCAGGCFEAVRSLDLTKSKIAGTAFFREGFHAAGEVDFRAATIDVLIDDETAWAGSTLLIDGLTIRRFAGDAPVDAAARIRWLERQPADHLGRDFRPQPWEECARVLAEMGHERDARILRVEKRRRMRWLDWNRVKTGKTRDAARRAWGVWIARRRAGATTRRILAARIRAHAVRVAAKFWRLPGVALDVVLDLATGYGWRPLRALGWLLALWVAAGLGYGTLPPGVMAPTDALVYLSPLIPEECKRDWISLDPRTGSLTDARQMEAAEALGLPRHERAGLQIVPEWKEICTRVMPSEYSTFSPFAYAADVLLPIVDLRQEHDWSPRVADATGQVIAPLWRDADWGWGHLARLGEWLLVLSGWGLSALLVGAVTGVIRRD